MSYHLIHVFAPDHDPIEPGEEEVGTVTTLAGEVAARQALARISAEWPHATRAELVEVHPVASWYADCEAEAERWDAPPRGEAVRLALVDALAAWRRRKPGSTSCPWSDKTECSMVRERAVAGTSQPTPACPVHDEEPF